MLLKNEYLINFYVIFIKINYKKSSIFLKNITFKLVLKNKKSYRLELPFSKTKISCYKKSHIISLNYKKLACILNYFTKVIIFN